MKTIAVSRENWYQLKLLSLEYDTTMDEVISMLLEHYKGQEN